jgi:hypothetical protein
LSDRFFTFKLYHFLMLTAAGNTNPLKIIQKDEETSDHSVEFFSLYFNFLEIAQRQYQRAGCNGRLRSLFLRVEDDAVVLLLEPLHGVLLVQHLRVSDAAGLAPAVTDVGAGAAEDNVEVHAVDAD